MQKNNLCLLIGCSFISTLFTSIGTLAQPLNGSFAGPLTEQGVRVACRESTQGNNYGDLIKIAIDIPSDTLGCDFQRASTSARLSRACQILYGGNVFFGDVVPYNAPYKKRRGCWNQAGR
jgi:hypothetical protein